MAIVVEDGTGVAGAETYHDRSFFNDFASSWGLGDASGYANSDYEAAARRGALVFDMVYGPRFAGYPVNSGQGLRFPMTELVDARGYSLPVLPVQVKRAAAALTWYELTSPMSLLPTVTPAKAKKSVTADKVSITYDTTAGGAGYLSGARPILAIVEGILAPLGGYGGGGPARYGSAVRG